ncbi:T9SS type A sorting domain-containing protein [Formosa undariae]|uniref:T9SS type A sorting domain-containing protein n=1 Tax=Formosa undariae TaxID=1325436 RepID=A0ABV5EXF7_9FLAO
MKTTLQLLCFLCCFTTAFAQEIDVSLSMQPNYESTVYYNLDTQAETSFTADAWDIGFLRTSSMSMSIRTNALVDVFEASNNTNDWSAIDVANEANWTKLYNGDTDWTSGSIDSGSASYGWGNYNMANHHVLGSVIFVLKYADGTYAKFINEDFYGGYTFKYATWDGTTWSDDKTETIANSENENNRFNYFSLKNGSKVIAEPAMDAWHLVFNRYYTDIEDNEGNLVKYLVTGILTNSGISVAINDEENDNTDLSNLTYSEDINTIGSDWKTFSMNTYSYEVNPNKAYYIKTESGAIYRLVFTSFEGMSTGNLSFTYEDVTQRLSIDNVNESISFGVYPNPTTDKKINLVYDVNALTSSNNEVAIYALTGAKVFATSLKNNSGFYNKELQLDNLQSGIYILKFTSGNTSTTKKLILN